MPVYFIHSIPAWRRCRREATDEVCPSIAATGRLPSTYLFAMRTGEGEGRRPGAANNWVNFYRRLTATLPSLLKEAF